MKLISIENYELKVTDEVLLMRPIRRLWNADRSHRKEQFFQQMSYLYNCIDPRSPYSYILDAEERSREIIKQEALPENFRPSEFLLEAMQWYREHTVTVSQNLLNDCLVAARKVGEFLREVDLAAEDEKGKPKYQVSNITSALKNVEGIVSTLQSLQKKVEQELNESEGKARGTQELTIGDNDF